MRSLSVSRLFLLLLTVTFSLVVALAVRFTYQFAQFSSAGTLLAKNLEETSRLNQELRDGIDRQIKLLHRQFDQLEPSFPMRLGSINYALGEQQTEYLKLDIDEQERLTIEEIKSLQAELGIQSIQAFQHLRTGARAEASLGLTSVEDLQRQIDHEFTQLYDAQMGKLQGVQSQLNRSVQAARIAVYSLTGGLLLALLTFTALLRRRVLKPLHSILEAADEIRGGNFTTHVAAPRPDELGQVAQAFNFMAESLAESYAGLERSVEDRTRQLEHLQEQFVQAAKMSAIGQLVSGVAHELNNPLTVILGYTELTQMRLRATGEDPKQLRLMEDLQIHAERCRKIVANLLQFARQVLPHLEIVWVNDVVEQVLQLREYELSIRNIRLERDYDPSNPILCGDLNKIQQVALNLLNNAYDAIREAGRAGTICVRTSTLDDQIVLEVADDGTGVRDIERVFDPFYTTKDVGQGTGLGLSVCYGIVKEHRGEIRAENLAKGARFVVTLPRGDLAAATKPKEARAHLRLPGKKFQALVVDDEEPLVRLQCAFLSSLGMEVAGRRSGEEAVRYLTEHAVDIVVSDVRMPGSVDGPELYEWVRANRAELSHRFLFVSGDLIGLNTSEFFLDTTVPCLQKPFKFDDYVDAIRQVLESEGESL